MLKQIILEKYMEKQIMTPTPLTVEEIREYIKDPFGHDWFKISKALLEGVDALQAENERLKWVREANYNRLHTILQNAQDGRLGVMEVNDLRCLRDLMQPSSAAAESEVTSD